MAVGIIKTCGDMEQKERPILFSGEMVRAILDGRKTQTRRIIKPQPCDRTTGGTNPIWGHGVPRNLERLPRSFWPGGSDIYGPRPWESFGVHCATDVDGSRVDKWISCPYGKPGDRLWVRESGWQPKDPSPRELRDGADTWPKWAYTADGYDAGDIEEFKEWGWKPRPSIHMPRWASRINLEITAVRIERLQKISEVDAQAEGRTMEKLLGADYFPWTWDTINGKKHAWASNPWVWVVEFKKMEAANANYYLAEMPLDAPTDEPFGTPTNAETEEATNAN